MHANLGLMSKPLSRVAVKPVQAAVPLDLILVLSGIVGWISAMAPLWSAAQLSPLCMPAANMAFHCPQCWVSAAMVATGLGMLAAGTVRK